MANNVRKIEYTKCYVAFLDVLGFKNLVLSNKQEDKQKIDEYFDLIERVTEYLKEIKAKRNLGSIIISDSVILSVPVGDTNIQKIENLRHLCIAVGKIQFSLALNNIWLRGAISSGDAYFNPTENQVIGPAYIAAYLLEERQAINPRVIIDNKIIKELKADSAQDFIEKINNKQDGGLQFTNWSKDVLFEWQHNDFVKKKLTKDIALFIDYLHPVFDDQTSLKTIIKNIEKSMYSANGVYSKFRWVVDYLMSNSEF
ncbi:MAG: hypothetical protein ABFQ53_04035, partial [Patescibacteria group bacterium]